MKISGAQSRHLDTALDEQAGGQPLPTAPLYKELSVPTPSLQQDMARAYKPIVQGYLMPAIAYYGLITIAHYSIEQGAVAHLLGLLSLFTALVGLFFNRVWLKEHDGFAHLELVNAVMSALIYINIATYLSIHFEAPKLVYFVLLILVIAASSVSARVIVVGSVVSLATMLWFAWNAGQEVFVQFAFIGLAGAFAAFGMAWLMRGAILRAVRARLLAEDLRHKAQIQADYDALTGMPNRRRFFSELSGLMENGGSGDRPIHLGIIDLDGFKPVNDLYGHAVGDGLLMEVALRLLRTCPASYLTARLGGDEFAVLIRRPMSEVDLLECGHAICEALARPYVVGGISINVTGCIGFASLPAGVSTIEQFYERADHALYCAKRGNGGEVVVFNEGHEAELSNISRVDQTLRHSDLEKELFVVFQPQVDAKTRRAVSFEALARWHSPTLGMVPPCDFIAAAERSGLIGRMTGILLRKALAVVATWPADIDLSFNLSARDLVSPKSMRNIAKIVRDSGIAPERLIFEITETSVVTDFDRAMGALHELAGMGCRIALDDFGAGYSNFGNIHRFPLHQVKVDRSFVTRLKEGATGQKIIVAIVELCNNLGLECLVEGVETQEELDAVVAAGTHVVQGYYFAKPMPALAVLDYLAAERTVEGLQKTA